LDEQRESPRTHQGTTFGGGDSILLLLDTADAGRNAQRRGRLPDSDDLPHRLTAAQPDHRRRHRNHLRVDDRHRLHALHPGRLTLAPWVWRGLGLEKALKRVRVQGEKTPEPWKGMRGEMPGALRQAWTDLRPLLVPMLIGVAIGAAIYE